MLKGKKKIQKEKKFYFSDIRPIIINVIILIILIVLLILVVRTKSSDLIKDENDSKDGTTVTETKLENQLTEESITIADNSCAVANKDEINKITPTITFEEVYAGEAIVEGSDPNDITYDEVFQKVAVITFENFDPSKYEVKAKIKDGEDVSENVVYDEFNNVAIFMANDATIVQEYEVEIIQTECGDTVKKFTLVAPIYNHFTEIDLCKLYPEYEWCASEISYKDLPTWTEFYRGVEGYATKLKNNEITTKTTQEIDSQIVTGHNQIDAVTTSTQSSSESKENKKDIFKYIIIGVCVILAIVVVIGAVIIFKKRGIKE